jgi:microsomal dipeptidase-like Zn-dependent dipeptidase
MFVKERRQVVQMHLLKSIAGLIKYMGKKQPSLLLKPAMVVFLSILAITAAPVQASSCGGAGERACCVASTERVNNLACDSGTIEISGCKGDCKCGGTGAAPFFGTSSSSSCAAVTQCGGAGQRACCLLERQYNNPIPFSAGCEGTQSGGLTNLTEIARPGGVAGGYCGSPNLFETRSNGICLSCGSDGARECVGTGVTIENKCQSGLSSVAGWCQQCGGVNQQICEVDSMCGRGLHPDFGLCVRDTVIEEPDCNCTVAPEDALNTDPATPVVGYADLHLHLFSNLAFGGLTLWGEAFHPDGGISQALRSDNVAQRTLRHQINGNTIKGVNGTKVAPEFFRAQTVVHGDNHFVTDALVTVFTGEGIVPNGGVEWDPNYDLGHFAGWPKATTTTHQQAYYRWLQRAHKGGLQLTVMLAVNNEAMCAGQPRLDYPVFDCKDTMAAVRLQLQAAKDMEYWLGRECTRGQQHACAKGQSPGTFPFLTPKQGWFKVVYSPKEAREAIALGQMAAVLGIEESFLFDCRPGSTTCDEDYVQKELDKYRALGVRHVFPLHNFDNAFGGSATWQDTVAIGNRYATGLWNTAQECPQFQSLNCINDSSCTADSNFGYDFKDLFDYLESDALDFFEDPDKYIGNVTKLLAANLTLTLGFGKNDLLESLANKPKNDLTTCNTIGLTSRGEFLIDELMARGMIIDIDHMSSISVDKTLSLAEAKNYPGVVASHVIMLDLNVESARHERMRSAKELQRIAALGGMIGVMTAPPDGDIIQPKNTNIANNCYNSSMTWGQSYEYAVDAMGGTPVAFGTDFNGIAMHNGPRFGETCRVLPANYPPMSYPFTLDGFGTFDVQVTGKRSFNFNTEGLAHVGLLPDMVQDLKTIGLTDETLKPLFSSAEKYISMWEGAELVAEAIVRDSEPPVLTLTYSTPANKSGWHNQPFTIEIAATDNVGVKLIEHSTIENPPNFLRKAGVNSVIKIPVTLDEFDEQFFAIAYDLAGNDSGLTSAAIKIDQLLPLIIATQSPRPNANGWNNAPVTVAYQCEDGFSGVSVCSDNRVLASDGKAQDAEGLAEDFAGNTAYVDVLRINIDQTAPTIVATQLPLPNAAGWVNRPVTITYLCEDSLSGVASCPATKVLSNDGLGQAALALVHDLADNTARADIAGINIDQEPPSVEIEGVEDDGDYLLGQVPIASCVTTDSLSGVSKAAVLSITGGTSSNVGLYLASCNDAVDLSGNTTNVSLSYWVRYVYDGFYSPVDNLPDINKAKAGSMIPIKFNLNGYHGLDIFANESPFSRSVSCDSGSTMNDTEQATNPGSRTLSYNADNDQYSYVWKTSKSWSGSCREFLLKLNDGSDHAAVFKFK